jgi:hypothetical protein
VLPPFWQTVTLFNPVLYLISGFRWAFVDFADVNVGVSLGMTVLFLVAPRHRVVDVQDGVSAEDVVGDVECERRPRGSHRCIARNPPQPSHEL